MPSSSTRKNSYTADKDIAIIIYHLLYHQPLEKASFSSLLSQYRSEIANNKLGIVEGCLVFYEKKSTAVNRIFRIVVLVYLRHTIFSLLHASPTAGHMVEYKTLYHIKLQLFWPKLRSDINRWIKECSYYQLTFR